MVIETLREEIEKKSYIIGSEYELVYSTMGQYFEDVFQDAKQSKVTWKKIHGDFWAYNYM